MAQRWSYQHGGIDINPYCRLVLFIVVWLRGLLSCFFVLKFTDVCEKNLSLMQFVKLHRQFVIAL